VIGNGGVGGVGIGIGGQTSSKGMISVSLGQ
jgi:hypothetical protein